MNPVIVKWQQSLYNLHTYYMENKPSTAVLYPALFIFFILVNDLSYWLAIATAFPELLYGSQFSYYYKIQFPVAILGALFDSISFFITLYIVKKALNSTTLASFICHLSVDLIIAILAVFWVVYVFSISGWVVNFTETYQGALSQRNFIFLEHMMDAVNEPVKNFRNIYIGIVMGISVMIPTVIHLFMGIKALFYVKVFKK